MRQKGHRDKKDLYDQIINLLKDHPDGMMAYEISQALEANDSTIRRTYLQDLIEQGKVITSKEWNKRRLYFLSADGNAPKQTKQKQNNKV